MKTIEEIKIICTEIVAHHEKFHNDVVDARIAKSLLLAIDGLKDIESSDGDPHVDESAEYWAKERSSLSARISLNEICKVFP